MTTGVLAVAAVLVVACPSLLCNAQLQTADNCTDVGVVQARRDTWMLELSMFASQAADGGLYFRDHVPKASTDAITLFIAQYIPFFDYHNFTMSWRHVTTSQVPICNKVHTDTAVCMDASRYPQHVCADTRAGDDDPATLVLTLPANTPCCHLPRVHPPPLEPSVDGVQTTPTAIDLSWSVPFTTQHTDDWIVEVLLELHGSNACSLCPATKLQGVRVGRATLDASTGHFTSFVGLEPDTTYWVKLVALGNFFDYTTTIAVTTALKKPEAVPRVLRSLTSSPHSLIYIVEAAREGELRYVSRTAIDHFGNVALNDTVPITHPSNKTMAARTQARAAAEHTAVTTSGDTSTARHSADSSEDGGTGGAGEEHRFPDALFAGTLGHATQLRIALYDLTPFHCYNVTLRVANDIGFGPPVHAEPLCTLSAVPRAPDPPQLTFVQHEDELRVNASWMPPAEPFSTILLWTLAAIDSNNNTIVIYEGPRLSHLFTRAELIGLGRTSLTCLVRATGGPGTSAWSRASTIDISEIVPSWVLHPDSRRRSSDQVLGAAIASTGALILVLIAVALAVLWRRKQRAPASAFEFPLADRWEIPRSQVTLGKEIGHGAFGTVYIGEGRHLSSDLPETVPVAVKVCRRDAAEAEHLSTFLQEMKLMKQFTTPCHPNVVRLLGVVSQSFPLLIVTEFVENGDLRQFLVDCRPGAKTGPNRVLYKKDLMQMSADIASGMSHLASKHFVHRDLSARNCLVASNLVVKIADFGLSKNVELTNGYYRKEDEGTLPVRWLAPECLLDGMFSTDGDVWAYGITLWEVWTLGNLPYPGLSNAEVANKVIRGYRLSQPPGCPDGVYEMMKRCWSDARPNFDSLAKAMHGLLDCISQCPNHEALRSSSISRRSPSPLVKLDDGADNASRLLTEPTARPGTVTSTARLQVPVPAVRRARRERGRATSAPERVAFNIAAESRSRPKQLSSLSIAETAPAPAANTTTANTTTANTTACTSTGARSSANVSGASSYASIMRVKMVDASGKETCVFVGNKASPQQQQHQQQQRYQCAPRRSVSCANTARDGQASVRPAAGALSAMQASSLDPTSKPQRRGQQQRDQHQQLRPEVLMEEAPSRRQQRMSGGWDWDATEFLDDDLDPGRNEQVAQREQPGIANQQASTTDVKRSGKRALPRFYSHGNRAYMSIRPLRRLKRGLAGNNSSCSMGGHPVPADDDGNDEDGEGGICDNGCDACPLLVTRGRTEPGTSAIATHHV